MTYLERRDLRLELLSWGDGPKRASHVQQILRVSPRAFGSVRFGSVFAEPSQLEALAHSLHRQNTEAIMRDMESPLTEYNPEMEQFEQEQFEQFEQPEQEQLEQLELSGETGFEVLSEAEAMELAAELLEVRDEGELDRFLGNLIRRVGSAVGKVVRSPVGSAIGGVLKGVLKKALPIAGGALGTFIGGPLGTTIGSGLASAAGRAMGLELEGLSQEDREFQAAKQFVQLAGDAVNKAVSSPQTVNPNAAAQAAMVSAARRFAPGLLRSGAATSSDAPTGRGRSGRWFRRGRNIIIINC